MVQDDKAAQHWKDELGKRLRASRKVAKLTLAKVGERIGKTKQLVGQQESGLSAPTPFDVALLADLYGVDAGWLLTGKRPKLAQPMEALPAQVPKIPSKRALLTAAADITNVREYRELPSYYLHKTFPERIVSRLQAPPDTVFAFDAFDNDLAPRIEIDDTVFCDLQKKPQPGQACLFALLATDQVFLRRYEPSSTAKGGVSVFSLTTSNGLIVPIVVSPKHQPVLLGTVIDAYLNPESVSAPQKSSQRRAAAD